MKRMLFCIFALLPFLFTPITPGPNPIWPIQTMEIAGELQIQKCQAQDLIVLADTVIRSQPSVNYENIVMQVPKGTMLSIDGVGNNWEVGAWLHVSKRKPIEGWILSATVAKFFCSPPVTPTPIPTHTATSIATPKKR